MDSIGAFLATSPAYAAKIPDMSRSNVLAHTPYKMVASDYRKYATLTLFLLTMVNAWISTVQAAEAPSASITQAQNKLKVMLHDSGITRIYDDLATTVLTETSIARHTCEDTSANAGNIQRFISQILDVDHLMDASVEQLSHSIEQPVIDKVSDWMKSDAGQQILEAEIQSADWSDDEYEQRKLALASNPDWNDARQRLILRVIEATATVSFIAALHTETSAFVLQAGDCIANDASRAVLKQRIQQARNDESFYSVFLRNDIHTTAAIIFSDVNGVDLEAYVVHSQSDAGQAWNKALKNSIRQVLSDRHLPIQNFLTVILHE